MLSFACLRVRLKATTGYSNVTMLRALLENLPQDIHQKRGMHSIRPRQNAHVGAIFFDLLIALFSQALEPSQNPSHFNIEGFPFQIPW